MYIDPITKALLLRDAAKNESPPLILMYHGTTPGNDRPSSRYSTTANSFIDQINIIKNFGWSTVCVRDLASPGKLPPRTLAITFDDGYSNNYAGAYLPLVERGMCATWFIVSNGIGKYAQWMSPRKDEYRLLSHEQLREMAASGMEIGAHTCTHPDLSRMDRSAIRSEVEGSRQELEDKLGVAVTSFAYPFGRWNEVAVDVVQSVGFTLACGVRPGWVDTGSEAFLLRRVTVFSDDTPGTFIRKLVFATNEANWKKMAGYLAARIRGRVCVWK
jgi:peptidoglycan/xylan/chitin deacetylase (PgdA/CDA1 family)